MTECHINKFSSRVCEKGTKGCNVRHGELSASNEKRCFMYIVIIKNECIYRTDNIDQFIASAGKDVEIIRVEQGVAEIYFNGEWVMLNEI